MHVSLERKLHTDAVLRRSEIIVQRSMGTVVQWLASLGPEILKKETDLGTEKERKAAASLRRTCWASHKVVDYLGCTMDELQSWEKSGKLPPFYVRKIGRIHNAGVRYWLPKDVIAAGFQIYQWRGLKLSQRAPISQ